MVEKILEFVGLPSPAVLLGVLIALAGVAGWSYHLGDASGANRVEADYSKRKDEAAEGLRQQLAAATERAMAAEALARKIADQNVAFQSTFTPLLKDIRNAKPVPAGCVSDDLRVRVNAAVGAIDQYGSAKTDYSFKLPAKLPTVTASGG